MLKEILLIDDNPIDVMMNERVIENLRFAEKITSRHSGAEALDLLNERISNNEPFPSLILLDMMMPHMDGGAFLNEFSKLPEEKLTTTYVVVVTSASSSVDIDQARSNPQVIDYLIKPLTADKLKGLTYKFNL